MSASLFILSRSQRIRPLYNSLITVAELRALLFDNKSGSPLLLFDCNHDLSDPEAGRENWRKQRIPGAQFLHLDEDLSGPIIPGLTGRHPLPAPEVFLATLKAKGYLGHQQQIVLYDSKGGGIAARAWWMLHWIGHPAVAVLDGGYPAWAKASGTENRASALAPEKGTVETVSILNCERVDEIRRRADWTLVDSRTAPRYAGIEEPIDPVAGHIEGAINLPWPENLTEAGHFRDRAALKNRFASIESKAANTVFYCGSGVTACHNMLAYYYATGEMPGLYPGSWSEWLIGQSKRE
jgi:thiosulfate/3-mercaptopyruvate sulfurtransferase